MDIEKLLRGIRTPKKHGRLIFAPSYEAGQFDSHIIDGSFPFYLDGRFWMIYLGWDGVGYQTALASSDDLLHWNGEGVVMGRGPKGSVTEYNAAMTCILRDNELFGPATLVKHNGYFVGTYHAYPDAGYEIGPAVIGLCFSKDLRSWEVGAPALEPAPDCAWESGGLYASWLMEADGLYYLFYNAKNRTKPWPWTEQIGMATSPDLVRWTRHANNPVLRVGPAGSYDDLFCADPRILKHEDVWLLFYMANCSDGHARNSVAFSHDLINWQKTDEILTDVGPEGSIDSKHAHNSGLIVKDGVLYHFYTAVSPATKEELNGIDYFEARGIALSTN